MFKTRLLSGIMLVIIALLTVGTGGGVLFSTLLIISLIGMIELYKVFKIDRSAPGIAGYIFTIAFYVLLLVKDILPPTVNWFVMLFMLYVITMMLIMVFSYPDFSTTQIFAAFFGLFYIPVMLSFIYSTRMLEQGKFIVWLVFFCSWGADTCAYCAGMLFGKHKMAPKLSPKKSVEGGIGGVLGASLLAFIYAICVNKFGGADVSTVSFAIIGAAAGAISIVGDLAASAIKRFHDIKDYGKLIPGHGGIMDRFDSVIITAPIIYYLAVLL